MLRSGPWTSFLVGILGLVEVVSRDGNDGRVRLQEDTQVGVMILDVIVVAEGC